MSNKEELYKSLQIFLDSNDWIKPYQYALYFKTPVRKHRTIISNYDEKWLNHYIYEGYYDLDHTKSLKKQLVEWGAHMSIGDLTVNEKKVFREATDYNLQNGITLAMPYPKGELMLTLSTALPFQTLQDATHYTNIPNILGYTLPHIIKIASNPQEAAKQVRKYSPKFRERSHTCNLVLVDSTVYRFKNYIW